MAENLQSGSSKMIDNKSKELLGNIIPDSLMIIDTLGNLVKVSQSALKLFNIIGDWVIENQTIFDFVHPSDHPHISGHLAKIILGENVSALTCRLTTQDEEIFNGEINAFLIAGFDGQDDHLILTVKKTDTPDNSFEAYQKEDLLHLLAHELRQPVNAIIGFSELMGRNIINPEYCDNEKLIKHNRLVTQQSHFLQNIIDQVFALASLDKFKINISTIDINTLLEELYEVFNIRREQICKANIELRVVKTPSNFNYKVCSDEAIIKQLFNNLIFNAFKYTNEGLVEFGFHTYETNSLTFFVSDTGSGIPAKKQQAIFNKYVRLNQETDSFKSVGLGLSLSQKLASLLGGQIWFKSTPGQGTIFYFSISPQITINEGSI
jgi:signal transduction histidine kinase